MHDIPDTLGDVVKFERQRADITIEALASKIGISERYLYRIENEKKNPSFEVLCKLIRVLNIKPDLIFYPEKPSKDSEVEDLVRMLYNCDERSIQVVRATVKALLNEE